MAALIEWGVATVTLTGYSKSGDAYVVQEFPDGALIAVLDGLGHGEEAAVVAKEATHILEAHAREGIVCLLAECHEGLRGTRGVVMSLAWLNKSPEELIWAGVGNVEGFLVRGNPEARPRVETLLLRPGVLGDRAPAFDASTVSLIKGDLIIFATDGIRPDFSEEIKAINQSPQRLAAHILSQYATGNDDALVLVARYLEPIK